MQVINMKILLWKHCFAACLFTVSLLAPSRVDAWPGSAMCISSCGANCYAGCLASSGALALTCAVATGGAAAYFAAVTAKVAVTSCSAACCSICFKFCAVPLAVDSYNGFFAVREWWRLRRM